MSEMSQRARTASKDKAERLARSDPHARVDASDYAPEGDMHGDIQTGPRPISPRQFRRGGMVSGKAPAPRADRKRRGTGGVLTSDSYQNLNVKEANKARAGTKQVGGMKRGGYATGGPTENDPAPTPPQSGSLQMGNPRYSRVAVDKAIASSNRSGQRIGRKEADSIHRLLKGRYDTGGRVAKLIGGALTPAQKLGIMRRPTVRMRASGGEAHADEAQDRKLIHKMGCQCGKCGGGRVERKAGGAVNDGTRPTGGRLARKGGGRTKKGTNVNIIIAPQGAGAAPAALPRPMPGVPPGAGPVGLHQGAPPVAPPNMPPGMPPPGVMPMRAAGGRAYPIDAGAGSGLGRLEKTRRAERS